MEREASKEEGREEGREENMRTNMAHQATHKLGGCYKRRGEENPLRYKGDQEIMGVKIGGGREENNTSMRQ